jgi:putative hydrolase of the HAD superfamily
MIKAVLFDLDDTLTDRQASLSKYSALFHREFAELLDAVTVKEIESTVIKLDEHGYRPRDEFYAGILEKLTWVDAPDLSAISDHWNTWFLQSTVGRSGLRETFDALAGADLRIGVVTNGSVLTQSAKIAGLGISHHLATVVISEAAGCKKPCTQIFQCALDDLGCLAGETLFVGDHPINDVLGSVEAGLIPVWFEGVHPWPMMHAIPERRIRALSDVLEFIDRHQ